MTEPFRLSASEARRLIESGALSVEALARSCLERVAARDAAVQAWAFLDPELVIAQARALDAAPVRGPLHGIPVGVKDVILTRDMPTRHNSPLHANDGQLLDAACIGTLRAAGALIFGKTVTTEFATIVRAGKTRNPFDPERTPGGSSSGSGAAVADFQVPLALGTQTGGSTIRPGSYCGIYAMKPTWSAISREGLKMLSPSLDTLGLYTRSAADLALLADVFGLEDATPRAPIAINTARIAVYRMPAWEKAEPATRDALDAAVALLRGAGAVVDEPPMPEGFDSLAAAHTAVMFGEARATFLDAYRMHGDALAEEFRNIVENDKHIARSDVIRAYDLVSRTRTAFEHAVADYDAVLAPSVPGEAPITRTHTGDASFNSLWTLLHMPVVNVPGFSGPNGMPVGLSLIGPRFSDRALVDIAGAVGAVFAAGAVASTRALVPG